MYVDRAMFKRCFISSRASIGTVAKIAIVCLVTASCICDIQFRWPSSLFKFQLHRGELAVWLPDYLWQVDLPMVRAQTEMGVRRYLQTRSPFYFEIAPARPELYPSLAQWEFGYVYQLPLWPIAAILIGMNVRQFSSWWVDKRDSKRIDKVACAKCGYDRRGIDLQSRCPECGNEDCQ
jgi:hypothetical protein